MYCPNISHFKCDLVSHQVNHARQRLGCSSLNYDIHRRNIIPPPLCACGAVETVSHYQRFTLCTFSRKSPFRKWSPYTRCIFKRFLKSTGIHCRIKAFWRLAIDPRWCVDIYSSGRRVWQITFPCFFSFLILTILNINVKNVSTVLIEI